MTSAVSHYIILQVNYIILQVNYILQVIIELDLRPRSSLSLV